MKIKTITRDHKGSFTQEELLLATTFCGEGYNRIEEGIDDQYTCFFFSNDTPRDTIHWTITNKYQIWHLLESGIEVNSHQELIDKINELGEAWDGGWEGV